MEPSCSILAAATAAFLLSAVVTAEADVQITDSNGRVIASLNPLQIILFGVSAAGAIAIGAQLGVEERKRQIKLQQEQRERERQQQEQLQYENQYSCQPRSYKCYYYYRKKRSAFDNEAADNEVWQSIKLMAKETFDVMANADPAECYKRIVCQQATEDPSLRLSPMKSILNLLQLEDSAVDHGDDLSRERKRFRQQLSDAQGIGKATRDVEFCNKSFRCPFPTWTLNVMMPKQKI